MNKKDELIEKLKEKSDYWWDRYDSTSDDDRLINENQRALGHARGYDGAVALVEAMITVNEETQR